MAYTTNTSLAAEFEDNEPVNTSVNRPSIERTPIETINVTTASKYSIEGEVLELQKRHYGTQDASKILDRSFTELTKTKDSVTPETFFNLYRELFFDIPRIGENSHTSLMIESRDYLNDYIDPKDEKIDELLNRVIEIEKEKATIPSEHPIFRNGSAIRIGTGPDDQGGALGIMQQGRLRRVSNQGDPSPFSQLKRPLGFIDRDGKPLSDGDCFTYVSSQTWNSLPKWPDFNGLSAINDQANLNLSLSDFEPPIAPIADIEAKIQDSSLSRLEIDSLIRRLSNKIPFEGFTIEDNYSGLINWSSEELTPFGFKGNIQGESRIYDNTTGLPSQGIEKLISNISKTYINNIEDIIVSLQEAGQNVFIDTIQSIGENISDFFTGLFGGSSGDEDAEEIQIQLDAKSSQAAQTARELLADIQADRLVRYIWTVDPEKLQSSNNAKFFWVRERGEGYKNFSVFKINQFLTALNSGRIGTINRLIID